MDTGLVFLDLGNGGQEGIYVIGHGFGGVGFPQTAKLIARGDLLDGRIVESLDIGRDAEFGVAVAFHATFTDGSSGIYYTVLPEPGTVAILPAFASLILRRRSRIAAIKG